MTEYGTIRIPRETYEKHNEKRKELGLSWEEYIDRVGFTDDGSLWTQEELLALVADHTFTEPDVREMARQEAEKIVREYSGRA